MDKWQNIMLILLIVVVLVILMRMSKIMEQQSATLLAVATKLGVEPPKRKIIEEEYDDDEEETEETEEENSEESEEETEENEKEAESVEAEVLDENNNVVSTTKIIALNQKSNPAIEKEKGIPSEPKQTRQEIYGMILDLFKDGIPRKRKQIEESLDIKNVKPGYMGDVISKARDKGLIGAQFIDLKDKWKSYYIFGLPDWYVKNKLKPEYEKKFKA